MTDNQKQQLLDEMLFQYQNREADFAIIADNGKLHIPNLSPGGIVQGWSETNRKYRGYCLEVNDHGNVTVWNCFKNGNRREVASRV
jgi:hypothetical protein